ncbi:HAD family acid phosphatase [Salinispirillum marinum]|uniref:HAD family acid phosphatase n=2 Tax=Saccharospirillaceae TaxID=255527 RepID=A0ABV8BE58_9GAMM
MSKPAVIVDLDGTLAQFDPIVVHDWVLTENKHWDKFFEYMENAPIISDIFRLVCILKESGQQILICSGRPETHRAESLDWLIANNVPHDAIYLRPDNSDHLLDEDVKRALFEKIQSDGFAPWLVLDDRSSVVAEWRKLGMTCLQCAPGDF